MVTENEAIRHAILMTIRMECSRVYISSDSQIVVNAVNRKVTVPKDIINLVEDIRRFCLHFKEFVLRYCCTNANRETDDLVRKAHI